MNSEATRATGKNTASSPIPGWFTLAEVSKLFGLKPHTLYARIIRKGSVKFKKVGTVCLLNSDDIMKLYEQFQMER